MRNLSVLAGKAVLTIVVLSGLVTAGSAGADVVSTCSDDGYLAMGNVFYDTRDYLLTGTYGGMFDGYCYMKFESLPTSPVQSAELLVTSIAQTGGMFPAPETSPVTMSVCAATADVADITDAASAIAYVANIGSVIDTITVTGGDVVYTLDVTDLVNQWIASGDNFGLMLTVGASDMGFPKFHSSETATQGAAPYLVSVVPEPATMTLLCAGAAGILCRRKRK